MAFSQSDYELARKYPGGVWGVSGYILSLGDQMRINAERQAAASISNPLPYSGGSTFQTIGTSSTLGSLPSYSGGTTKTASTSYAPYALPSIAQLPSVPAVPAVPTPQVTTPPIANLPQVSSDYPWYLRNIGEQEAQRAFQRRVNTGIRMGGAPQVFQAAESARNLERLGYMAKAGGAEFGISREQAAQQQAFNAQRQAEYQAKIQEQAQQLQALLTGRSQDVAQRGQSLDYLQSLAQLNVQQRAQDIQAETARRGQDISYQEALLRAQTEMMAPKGGGGGSLVTIGGNRVIGPSQQKYSAGPGGSTFTGTTSRYASPSSGWVGFTQR